MLALTPLRTVPAPAAPLVLLRDPIEVGADGLSVSAGLPDPASVNHLRNIRHHPSAGLEGCVGFVLGWLRRPGNKADVDALIRPRTALLQSKGIGSKDQLVDLLATAQSLDLLNVLIHTSHLDATFDACSPNNERDAISCEGKPIRQVRYCRPTDDELPAFLRNAEARSACTTPWSDTGVAPSSRWGASGRCLYQTHPLTGLALAGRSEVLRKTVAAWMDPALHVPAAIVARYVRHRLDEISGQAGLARLLARVDLEDCIERLRTSIPQHACDALRHTGAHIADVLLVLENVVAAGKRALGPAFALGGDEVLAELTSKGGWASHSILMAGLVAATTPSRATPAFKQSVADVVRQGRAAAPGESTAAWEARAARVMCDVARLAILLTVYDIWGVAAGTTPALPA